MKGFVGARVDMERKEGREENTNGEIEMVGERDRET